MRIAIIIGVSEYGEIFSSLPAAARDATGMKRLLDATGKYESVLILSGKLEAESTKRQLMMFLEPYRGASVDEVLFYYSGHGAVASSGLAFAMSDYSDRRVFRGSFENEELDNYLRAVSPKVAVKILDCCYSGIRYIKGPKDDTLALDGSAKSFTDCYFFFSSRHDQESWAGTAPHSLSIFTQYFLDAIVEQSDGVVRYKQIADSISDRFLKEQQEPQFVIQGNMRHEFCIVNEKIRLAASNKLSEAQPDRDREEPEAEVRVGDLVVNIRRRAELCILQEEADDTLSELRAKLEGLEPNTTLTQFYEEKLWFPESIDLDDDVAAEEAIGKWFKYNGQSFFGWATETDPSRRSVSIASMITGFDERPRVTGFVTTAELEYDRVFVRHVPRFSGLARWEMAALILWSPWKAAVFYYGTPLQRLGWERYDQPESVRWARRLFTREELPNLSDYVVSKVREHRQTVASYLRRYAGINT